MTDESREVGSAPVSHEQLRSILGDISEDRLDAILATGASMKDISEANAIAQGASDIAGIGERPLSGAAAEVYLILTSKTPGAT